MTVNYCPNVIGESNIDEMVKVCDVDVNCIILLGDQVPPSVQQLRLVLD